MKNKTSQKIAVIGAGIAGIACARTLAKAGHTVQVFEKSRGFGGRMSTRRTPFGSFDHGAQFFTVRDARFRKALGTTPGSIAQWADAHQSTSAYVAVPGMSALIAEWAYPLQHDQSGRHQVYLETTVKSIERDPIQKTKWQVRTEASDQSVHVEGGFHQVVMAIPSIQAAELLKTLDQKAMLDQLASVKVAPCWTLMVAFPQIADHSSPFGPSWNAKRVEHSRIAWLARESSKPHREATERWTVQAPADWSQEHLEDDAQTVQAKLLRAFAEVTGIKAEPAYASVHRWRYAQTLKPLQTKDGKPYLLNEKAGLSVCGDWCIGHRVEDGFVSGLELALRLV